MAKINKKIVMIIGMLAFNFLFVEVISGQEIAIDYSSEPIQTLVVHQNCLRNGEYDKIWEESLAEMIKTDVGSVARYKEAITGRLLNIMEDIYTAELRTMTYLTDRRIWVKIISSDKTFPGFYLIKEGGRWKIARFSVYSKKAEKDMRRLCEAIKAYHEENGELSAQLAELISPVS